MTHGGMIYRNFTNRRLPPKLKDLRIWWVPQITCDPFEWPVTDLVQAALIIDALAAYDDFQYEQNIKGDYSNVGGLQIFDGSDWVDWEDEDGDDFDCWRDKNTFPIHLADRDTP